jgi:GNAT superfamily N-acetyltransferase
MDEDINIAIEIRAAGTADCAALAKLAGQLGYESSPEQVAQRLEGLRKPGENAVFVAQERGGEIIGWISVYVFRTVTSDARVEISGFVVDERYRSRKIGATLLKSTEEWALARGCGAIGVHTNVARSRAHAFYERNGYRLVKTQKFYRKDLAV